jgi:hypothetical protein
MSVDRALFFVVVRARIPAARCLLLLPTLALFFCFFCGLSVPPPTTTTPPPPPPSTVIPRLTKIIRSGITFVSRNLR